MNIADKLTHYAKVEGKSKEQLDVELKEIYSAYPEYSDPDYGGGDFLAMVRKFAGDDYYRAHYAARQYLGLPIDVRDDPQVSAKARATAEFLARRDKHMRANDHLSFVWRGYRHCLAAGGATMALEYVRDMPESLSRLFALQNIKVSQGQGAVPATLQTKGKLPDPALHAKRKAAAIAHYGQAQAAYFEALDGLTAAWSGVQQYLDAHQFDEAHKFLGDMPDSSAKTMLVCKVMDAEEAEKQSMAPEVRA